MGESNLYVKIPRALEIKRKLLEAKRTIYMHYHDAFTRKSRLESERILIDRAEKAIKELKELVRKVKSRLPKIEEEEKKRGKKTRKKERKKEKREEIKSEAKEEPKVSELEELKRIEEELKKIEEELRKLS